MAPKYLIINYKTYAEASGENAIKLTEIISNAEKPAGLELVICLQAADIYRVREQFPHIQIWAQHIDPIDPGRNTGWTSPETVVMAGANGTLVNHSEHNLTTETINNTLKEARERSLTTCLAVPDLTAAKELISLKPDLLTWEPADLISGNVSQLDVNRDEAEQFYTELTSFSVPLLLGAGIKQPADISQALAIGYAGVLISSGFVLAQNPAEFLKSALAAFAQ